MFSGLWLKDECVQRHGLVEEDGRKSEAGVAGVPSFKTSLNLGVAYADADACPIQLPNVG